MNVFCLHCKKECQQPEWRHAQLCSGSCRTKYWNARRPKGERHINQSCHQAVESPTILDIAWAAGIYEGEGHVQRQYQRQRCCVTQKDTWILEKLKRLFGGSIYTAKTGAKCSAWYISGPRARGFLYTIFCFLSPRRKQQILEKLKCV